MRQRLHRKILYIIMNIKGVMCLMRKRNISDYGDIFFSLPTKEKERFISFDDILEIDKWIENNKLDYISKQQSNNLDHLVKYCKKSNLDFQNSIKAYKGNYSKAINAALEANNFSSLSNQKYAHILLLINSISYSKIPEDIIVYRLVNDKEFCKIIKNNKNHKGTPHKGFLSTSLSKNIAKSKAFSDRKYLLKIYVKKNTCGLYMGMSINKNLEHEKEMLFLPNSFIYLIDDPFYDDYINKIIVPCTIVYY